MSEQADRPRTDTNKMMQAGIVEKLLNKAPKLPLPLAFLKIFNNLVFP
ncbi:hypothetical protein [Alteromonas antoniana]|nr:hypothetical protein [Alteromonas antoniana]